jgi:type I restriction enzyme S subunit
VISRNSFGDSYPISKLGDAVEFLDNLRRPITEADRKAGPFPYYGANGQQGTIDKFIFDEPLVLLAEDGGHFGNPDRGIAYRVRGKTWVNNHAHVLRAKPHIDLDYLCRVLENYDVTPFVTGTTRGKLTKAGASEIPIPVPPLPEQRRIAAVLDKTDALRAKRYQALAHLDNLEQSIFVEMFGDPVTNPMGWEVCTVGDVTACIVPGRDKPKSFSGKVPWVTTEDLLHLGVTFRSGKGLGLSQSEISEVRARVIPAGSVVISCVGKLGISTIAGNDMVINQQLHSFQCDPRVNNVFLMYFLATQSAFMYSKASSTTLPYMNKSVCNSIPLHLPPVDLQEAFSRRISKILMVRELHQHFISRLDSMKETLQYRAFRGKI